MGPPGVYTHDEIKETLLGRSPKEALFLVMEKTPHQVAHRIVGKKGEKPAFINRLKAPFKGSSA